MREKLKQIIQKFKYHNCCVIVPTYNNAATIESVLNDVLSYCEDVIVVNDGSTDETSEKLKEYRSNITLVEYKQNQGKGHALITGFRAARAEGYNYAITIDSDGQHYASDLEVFLDALSENEKSVLIGARKQAKEHQSKGSKFANNFSNFWFKIETGESPEDTQSGYRLYPLKPISKMKFFTKKYEFEIEVLVRLSWRGYNIRTIPVNVFYPPIEERVSHFRPGRDFIRISILNTVLVFLALIFFLPRNMFRKFRTKSLKTIFKESIVGSKTSTTMAAISVGYGVFFGIVPIWGYQLIVGLSLAHFLKLHKGIVFLAANISIPPMIPIILYFSYVLGGFILGNGTWSIHLSEVTMDTVKNDIIQYIVGSLVLAISAGLGIGFLSFWIIKLIRLRRSN